MLAKRLLLEALPAHNEAIEGDSLFSIQLNYKWRLIIAQLLHQYFWEDDSDISYDNENHLTALIEDLYTSENICSNVNISTQNIDLLSNDTTTSTSFGNMTNSGFAFTPTKANCLVRVSTLVLVNSGAGEVWARVRLNHGDLENEAMALMASNTRREMSASAVYSALPIGTPVSGGIEWKVTSGTGTVNGDVWPIVEIIEFD